jgi:hypothetical protein
MFLANKLNKGGSLSTPDAQFNYVTMLLHGDGTNGAQNNTFVDGSTNNFTITRNGNTTQGSFSPYGSNWSNYFATTNYLTVPSNSAFSFGTGDFTVEGWFFQTTDITYPAALEIGNHLASTAIIFITNNGGNATIYSGGFYATAATTLNAWNHIAWVRSSGSLKIYVNGVGGSAVSFTNNLTDTGTVTIGTSSYVFSEQYYYSGYISNLRVVKGTAVYTSNFTPSTTALTAISGTSLLTCQSNRFIDNSANNFTITASGTSVQRFNPFGTATAYSTSVISGSGYFDGTGDVLSFSNNTAFAFGTGSFTIEFWINGPLNNDKFILEGRNAIGTMHITTGGVSSTVGVLRYVGSSTIVSSNVITDNSWHHCAIVRNGSSNITLYVDGISVGTGTDTTNYTSTSGTFDGIGGRAAVGNYLTGYLSNFRIVKGTAVYTTAFTPPTAPLTAISGTSLLLLTINGAIFDNAMITTLETVGDAQISTSVKKYGTGSLKFDGTSDYLTGKTVPIGSGDLTIECWVYLNVATGDQHFVQVDGASDSNVFLSLDSGANKFRFVVRNDAGTNNISITSSISPSANTWYHIAGVVSGSNAYLFVDGSTTSGATGTLSGTRSGTGTNAYLGVNGSGGFRPLNGYLDDVRITKGYARYTANFTPPTVALSDTGPV